MDRELLNKITDRIKVFEGYSDKPYVCPAGKLTIGWGYNFEDNGLPINVPLSLLRHLFSDGFTVELAEWLLEREATAAYGHACNFKWFPKLNPPRQAVITDMIYQMGLGGLMGFRKAIKHLSNLNYAEAAAEMRDSKWYGQSGRRSKINVQQMITGNWIDV